MVADGWHYYLGQCKYAARLAGQLVTRLLANAIPDNPPITDYDGPVQE